MDSPLAFDEVKDEEIIEWYTKKQLKSKFRVGINDIDQNKAKILIPKLVDDKTGESGADPWVIALAQELQNGIVVSQEQPSNNKDKPKIPNVCNDLNIECIKIVELIQREKWEF